MNTSASASAWLLLGLCALSGCEPSVPPPTQAAVVLDTAPADKPVIDDAQALALLAARLGPAVRLQGAWAGSAPGASASVCADDSIGTADQPLRMLAVCTTLRVDDVTAGGQVDLFAFGLRDGRPVVVAESRGLRHGIKGDPGQVKLVRIGRVRYAFDVLHARFDDEGELQPRTWYVLHGDRFVATMTVPAHYASDGRAWCRYAETTTCEGASTDLAYDLRVDARDADADAYPVTVTVRGMRCDQTIAETTHALAFDPATSTHVVPQALRIPAGDCRSDPPPAPEGADPVRPREMRAAARTAR